jgi:anti-sigma-K factor RskA
MAKTVNRHLGDEIAEKYSLGSLPVRKVAGIEKHLLTCEPCRLAVTASDAYVHAMRTAAAKFRQAEQKSNPGIAGK